MTDKTTNNHEMSIEKVCSLNYLTVMMGGKSSLIKEIMDVFIKQIPEELQAIKNAIAVVDYSAIKNIAHSMKSSVSIMGIASLAPVLQEMEDLGGKKANIKKIEELDLILGSICQQAIGEIENEVIKYK